MADMINHPPHYKSKPVEAIEICEWLGFAMGNAAKYLYRYADKGRPVEDLRKAVWYLRRTARNPVRTFLSLDPKLPPVQAVTTLIAAEPSPNIRAAWILFQQAMVDDDPAELRRHLTEAADLVEAEVANIEQKKDDLFSGK